MRNFQAFDVWNRLLSKPFQLMTEAEQNIRAVNVFLVDFERGDWLYNSSPSANEDQRTWVALRATAASLAAIGASRVADLLVQIVDLVEQVPPPSSGTWRDFLAKADPQNRIPVLETQIAADIDGAYGLLEEYTVKHLPADDG